LHGHLPEPVLNCPEMSDPSRWCRSVLGPKCLRVWSLCTPFSTVWQNCFC